VQLLFSEDLGAGFARAVNDWMAAEWLDKEPRLRASIVVPVQNPEMAVDEIERVAPDRRFVQVLMLVMGDMPLGKRHYWPIYAAAERHGLPIGIHAGSSYRHPVTPLGWPTYYTEDYAAQAAAFQQGLSSLICEGVFTKFPALKVVLIESGFTWLPAHLWRLTKFWRGLRMEIPWVDRAPSDIVRSNVRLTTQPCDAPPTTEAFSACSTTWGPTNCCCSPPIIRTGSSTAGPSCRKACHRGWCGRSCSTIRGRPTPA
jgi:predicted TIM-barrel fold metal-dependent hydrolase